MLNERSKKKLLSTVNYNKSNSVINNCFLNVFCFLVGPSEAKTCLSLTIFALAFDWQADKVFYISGHEISCSSTVEANIME